MLKKKFKLNSTEIKDIFIKKTPYKVSRGVFFDIKIYYLKEAPFTFAEDAVQEIYDFGHPQENMLQIALGVFFGTSKVKQSQEKKWKIQHRKVSEKNIIEE